MKIEALKQRLDRNRPMTSVTIRMPEDVVEVLKKVAPLLGFSGYQPLIRAYIGQCLRSDLERFESETVTALVASLKRRGVSEAVIDKALSEVVHAESQQVELLWVVYEDTQTNLTLRKFPSPCKTSTQA
jgi:hypothetical protein